MKVRKILDRSTYNVRTFLKKEQVYQHIKGYKQINLVAVAIQEHRWRTDNDTDIRKNRDYHFFYASA